MNRNDISGRMLNMSDSLYLNYGNLPAEKHFIGEIIRTRIAERSTLSGSNAYRLGFHLDPAFAEEEFSVKTDTESGSITGGSFRALLFGAGVFLRSIDYRSDSFFVPMQRLRMTPAAEHRECYFARHFHNYYHMAPPEEFSRYIEDLALWGFNTFNTQSLPTINLSSDTPEEELRKLADDFHKLVATIRKLDCKLAAFDSFNQGLMDAPEAIRAVPNTDSLRGNNGVNICPSLPEGLKYLDEIYLKSLEPFRDIRPDFTYFWPFDEGGCECEKCRPYGGNGYLRFIEHRIPMLKKQFGEQVKIIIATWAFHEDEYERLYRWLETRNDIDSIMSDAHGNYPAYPLMHKLPGRAKLITFPEISMWGRSPWGGYGATPLPEHFTKLWNQIRGHVDGCRLYSEGLFEDINKVIVGGFYMNSGSRAEDLLREYARYEFCGADPEEFVRLCRELETIHIRNVHGFDPGKLDFDSYRPHAVEALALAMRLDSQISPRLRSAWRWRLFYLRAVLEYELCVHGTLDTEAAVDAMKELIRLYRNEEEEGFWRKTAGDFMHTCIRPPLKNGITPLKMSSPAK